MVGARAAARMIVDPGGTIVVIVVDVAVHAQMLLIVATSSFAISGPSPVGVVVAVTLTEALMLDASPVVVILGVAGGLAIIVVGTAGGSTTFAGGIGFLVRKSDLVLGWVDGVVVDDDGPAGLALGVGGLIVAGRGGSTDLDANVSILKAIGEVIAVVVGGQGDMFIVLATSAVVGQQFVGLLDPMELVLLGGA